MRSSAAARRIAPPHIERLREILANEAGAADDFDRIAVYRAVVDELGQGEGATEACLETAKGLLSLVAQEAGAQTRGP